MIAERRQKEVTRSACCGCGRMNRGIVERTKSGEKVRIPRAYCPACIHRMVANWFAPATATEPPESRTIRPTRAEREAAKREKGFREWARWQIQEVARRIPCKGTSFTGFPDLDGAGGWGLHVRLYEDCG